MKVPEQRGQPDWVSRTLSSFASLIGSMDILLTKDDTAWLTDPASIVPFMACSNGKVLVPVSLSDIGLSRNDRAMPHHKYRGLLTEPTTLASYHAINQSSLLSAPVPWPEAIEAFRRSK